MIYCHATIPVLLAPPQYLMRSIGSQASQLQPSAFSTPPSRTQYRPKTSLYHRHCHYGSIYSSRRVPSSKPCLEKVFGNLSGISADPISHAVHGYVETGHRSPKFVAHRSQQKSSIPSKEM